METKNTIVVVKVAILLMFVAHASSFMSSGPYDITNVHLLPCEDQGTNELKISMQMYRTQDRNKRILAHRGEITWPSRNDNYRVFMSVHKWGTDWILLTDYDDTVCNAVALIPELYSDACKMMGVNDTCPIPPGRHTFEDWIVRVKVLPPILPYGKYRAKVNMYGDDKKVMGCLYVHFDVVQKFG